LFFIFLHLFKEKLPEYFNAWNDLAQQMAEIVVKKQMRKHVEKVTDIM